MFLQIQNACYPFFSTQTSTNAPKSILAHRRITLPSEPSSPLEALIDRLTRLALTNLVAIRFIEREKTHVDLYYQRVDLSLSQAISDMDLDDVRQLHRQFIDLAIGLAKKGITTEFDQKCCGAIGQNEEVIIKYYLDVQKVMHTEDLQLVEARVSQFCGLAMEYMRREVEKEQPEHKLINCLSDKELTRSFDISSEDCPSPLPRQEDKMQESKVSGHSGQSNRASKGVKAKKSFSKEDSLRKLSIMSRQLSQISARHRHKEMPGIPAQRRVSIADSSHKYQQQVTRVSESSLFESSSSTQSVPNPLLLARSKQARQQLAQIKQRMAPYGQIYSILTKTLVQ